jgi:hypothetical protein
MADTMTLEQVRKGMSECIDMRVHPWLETVMFWQNAIDAAIKQREQDAKDAARYRWLKENVNCDLLPEDVIDEAIVAMAKESGNG